MSTQKDGNSISQVEQEDSYQTDRYEQERFTDTYSEYFEDDEICRLNIQKIFLIYSRIWSLYD